MEHGLVSYGGVFPAHPSVVRQNARPTGAGAVHILWIVQWQARAHPFDGAAWQTHAHPFDGAACKTRARPFDGAACIAARTSI